jgi:phosphopantetheinyl transferase
LPRRKREHVHIAIHLAERRRFGRAGYDYRFVLNRRSRGLLLCINEGRTQDESEPGFHSELSIVPHALNWAFVIAHPVDVWTVALDLPRADWLAPDERERANRFRFEADRLHWTNARSALREILGAYLNVAPSAIAFAYGPNGKPSVEGVEFNLSHSRNWAVIAINRDVPVGADIEAIRPEVEIENLLRRIGEKTSGGSAKDLFQMWTLREARTKAIGAQLMQQPPDDVFAIDIEAPDGFAAAVALYGRIPAVRHCGGSV